MQQIASESVDQMVDHAAIVERINANESRGAWLLWMGYPAAVLLAFAWPEYGWMLGVLMVIGCYLIRNRLRAAAPVEFEYQLDGEELQKQEELRRSLEALIKCHRVWQINSFGNTHDWKRNAGANQLVKRSPASALFETPPSFKSNVGVGKLKLQNETLYFLPDIILVKQRGKFGAVSYRNLEAAHSLTNFREEEGVANDAHVIGSTWRFVNKKGGPDRRFNNNRQIPIVLYGEAVLISQSGLRLAVMTSSSQAAEAFVNGIRFVQSSNTPSFVYQRVIGSSLN